MIHAAADLTALTARLIAKARALAEAKPAHWRDARRLWPLFTKD